MRRDDDTDTRVRPIPVDSDSDVAPASSDRESTIPGRSRRRGLAAAVGAVAVAVLLVAGIGALGEREPGSPTDEAADSPHIDDGGSLVLAARLDSAGWVIEWTPLPGSQPTGAIGAIPSPLTQVAEAPTIDRSREWLASPDCDGSGCDLSITLTRDRTLRVASLTARDHVWHSEEAARIAWIEDAEGASVLRTGFIDSDIAFQRDPMPVDMAAAMELHRWDDHGFIVAAGSETQALDSNGRSAWTTDGILLDATSKVVVVEHADGAWSILDRSTGTVVAAGSNSGPGVQISAERLLDVVSTSAEGETRHTFRVDDRPTPGAGAAALTVIPTGSAIGTEYRLLRDDLGDRFTVHVTAPRGIADES